MAKVPANLKDRKARFTQLGEKLADKAEDMHDTCDAKNGDATLEALTKVHTAFEDLMEPSCTDLGLIHVIELRSLS